MITDRKPTKEEKKAARQRADLKSQAIEDAWKIANEARAKALIEELGD